MKYENEKSSQGVWARAIHVFAGISLALIAPLTFGASLVGYWNLNASSGTTAADASGSSNTGTLVNSPPWVAGQIGNALNFASPGTSYVAVPASTTLANLASTGMTAMAWIKPRSTGGGGKGRIIDKDNNNAGWFFNMNSTTTVQFGLDLFATSQPNRVSSASIALNTWQHVAVTWDGSTTGSNIHIYINGALADGTSANGSGAADDDSGVPLEIGNRSVDTARGFDGLIDEVRIYNGILTATQIQSLADSTAPTAPTGLNATAASSSQINLSWTASTDNIGVTSYLIERCSGASCSTFTQIASATGATYSDSSLTASTSYSYRIRATDAATNSGPYSSVATVSTPSADTQAPTTPASLTATTASSSQINLSWSASTDNVGVTNYLIERCSGASCSTFTQIATASGTTYSNSGLSSSTAYSYRVRATDAASNLSAYSNIGTATTGSAGDTTAPTAPTTLSATVVSSSAINLSWTASTDNVGVTGYQIERCAGASCSTFSQIGTSTVTSYSSTGLTASTAYSYRVRATDAAGNLSTYSNTGSATTSSAADTSAPTAPSSLTATAASSSLINLSWASSTDNVGVTNYLIERCSGASCSTFSQVATATGTTYADSPLSASTSYSYRVRATDAAANLSAYSATASASTSAAADTTAPTVPTALSATSISPSQVNLSWTASTDNVGVTNYLIERCSGTSCSTFSQVATSTGTTYSNTSLTASTAYSYRVRATDAASNLSTYSNIASATTGSAGDTLAPTAPTGLSAFAASSTQITLSWTASTDNVGVTGYLVERCSGSGCSTFTQVGTSTLTSYSDSGLSAGTSYSYRVRATDAATNLSSYSSTASATTSSGSGSSLVGYWSLNDGSGTTAADGSGSGNGGTLTNSPTWATGKVGGALNFASGGSSYVAIPASASLANLRTTGMTLTAWIYPRSAGSSGGRVVDKDNDDAGWFLKMASSNSLQFAIDQFATTAATRTSTSALTLNTWQHVAVTWDGSATATNIHLYVNGTGADSTAVNGVGAATNDSATPLEIGNRSLDHTRGFDGLIDEVRVYNRVLSQTEIQALSDVAAPSTPSTLTATAISNVQINLSWGFSTDNVGVTNYLVERCAGTGCSSFSQIASSTGTTYNDTGRAASTPYSYRVRASDAASNFSAYSNTASATTPAGDAYPPSAPSSLTATVASGTQVNLSWGASTDNVGVTGYLIERCSGASCTSFSQIATSAGTTYSDTGLIAGSYTYRVRAADAATNLSSYSNTATAQPGTDTQPPTAPTGLSATASSATQINLTWGASTDNVVVTNYLVERCTGACTSFTQIGSVSNTTFGDTGLSANTAYGYRVRAADAAANLSSYSNTATATTQANSALCD